MAGLGAGNMVMDEYGRPYIILREQQARARLRGKDAQKVSGLFTPVYSGKRTKNQELFLAAAAAASFPASSSPDAACE